LCIRDSVWAGLRPMPPDGQPIVGALPGAPGLYVAVGHSGITLCPQHGRVLAALLEDCSLDPLLEPITPAERLAGGRVAAPAALD
jgi:glycine/D-amino acid oxidase-like deaminating enzyme